MAKNMVTILAEERRALQQDFAEAIAQLALYTPGREALLKNPTVAEALQQVVADGWTEEAQQSAESALAALSDHQPESHVERDQDHVMISYQVSLCLCMLPCLCLTLRLLSGQWNVQQMAKRIVRELQARGYRTWFGGRDENTLLPPMMMSPFVSDEHRPQPHPNTRLLCAIQTWIT